MIVHPGLEALLVVGRPVLQRVGSKTDQVEVPLHEVQDQALPTNLLDDIDSSIRIPTLIQEQTCLSSVETSYFHFDSMIASLMFCSPVPFGVGPHMSITLNMVIVLAFHGCLFGDCCNLYWKSYSINLSLGLHHYRVVLEKSFDDIELTLNKTGFRFKIKAD